MDFYGRDLMIIKFCEESKILSGFQQDEYWPYGGQIFCVKHWLHLTLNNFWYTSEVECYIAVKINEMLLFLYITYVILHDGNVNKAENLSHCI